MPNKKIPAWPIPQWLTLLFTHKHLAAIISSLVFGVFILPLNEGLAFTMSADRRSMIMSSLLRAGFGLVLYAVTFFALEFAQRVASGNRLYRQWLKYSSLYLLIMLPVFLLIYPGHWVWDEFNILNSVKSYLPDFWQSSFTYIFYAFSQYLFPAGVSIVVIQLLFVSAVVGYVISRFAARIRYKRAPLFLFVLFLLPPIVLNNFYPLRITMYSYLELLFLARIILLYFDGFRPTNKYRELLALSFMIMLLSFWRSEGAYYLAFLPALIIAFKIFNKNSLRTFAPYAYSLGAVAIIAAGGLLALKTTDTKYSLTTFVNPLTVVLQGPLKGEKLDQNLTSIDKVLRLDKMRQYPSYTEITAFWDGGVRPDYKEHLPEFYKAYAQLVIDNPGPFLKARTKTFLAANGLENSTPSPVGLLIQDNFRDKTEEFVATRFYNTNPFSHPISTKIKRKVTRILLMVDAKDHVSYMGKIFWSVVPAILGLVFLLIHSLVRKRWFWAVISGVVLARVLAIFITAPAHYFFYYLPVYISGYFVLLVSLLLYLDNRRKHLTTK